MEQEQKRLNKYIGETGFCSRREADEYIEQGRVTVNGAPAIMGMKVSNDDEVRIDGKIVREKNEKPVYLAFNKPPGIECTTNLEVKDNIVDFINYPKRIFPIGRLDKASEGLIFMTNDGDIVNKILRARNNHEKEYTVTVDKPITSRFIDRMGNGVPILDTVTRKCHVEQISKYTFKIILTQGLNRQIRRMCEYLGYEVTRLIRIRIINISLDLPQGRWRDLTDAEIVELNQLIEPSSKTEEASLPKVEKEPRVKSQESRSTERKPFQGEKRSNRDQPKRESAEKKPRWNVEFVQREDTKTMRDEKPASDEKPTAKKRNVEFVKKEDSKIIDKKPFEKPSEKPANETLSDQPKTGKRWNVQVISKDDPTYRKKGEY
ncbi:S4 domain-containing protein [Flavobacterium caeni]|uniref:Pseudouridine synthase n=1 Tax=Flavobacterium caeni TaxID=490189 RepID=A0A1G5FSW2_9FLAO|nr:S4 domain-containing protein [Flavobacterium caeni]